MRRLIILATASLLIPAVSQAASLEDLLVEKGVISKSEARASMGGGAAKVYWNNGTRLEFPDNGFTTKINTQLQARYTFTNRDEADNVSSFSIRRARIAISGTALNNEFEYKVETDLVGTTDAGSGDSIAHLRDGWIRWNACDNGSFQMGQFKAAISRQENAHSSALQFAERSVASNFFAIGRARGAQVGYNPNEDWSLVAQIFNGESDGEGLNRDGVDTDHEFVVGVRGNLMGHMDAMEEGDVDMTQEAALNVGAAYSGGTLTTAGTEVKLQRISADVNFKSNGLSANAEFFWADIDPDIDGSESTSPVGGYLQAGYMLNENLELAGRWSMIDCDNATGAVVTDDTAVACVGDNTQEWSASVNYYWWKHHMKAQFGFTREILDSGAGTNDIDTNKWVFQLSAYV